MNWRKTVFASKCEYAEFEMLLSRNGLSRWIPSGDGFPKIVRFTHIFDSNQLAFESIYLLISGDVWNSGHSMVIFHNVRAKHFHLLDFLLSDSGPNNNFPNLSDFHSDEMKTSDGCWAINRIRLIRFSVIWFWVKWK